MPPTAGRSSRDVAQSDPVAGSKQAVAGSSTGEAKSGNAVWLGPQHEELGWLAGRITQRTHLAWDQAFQASRCQDNTAETIERLAESTPQQIIVALDNRIDVDLNLLNSIIAALPEVPLAVATSTWWDGSARTGLLYRPVPFMAWHRWWDSWSPWLTQPPAGQLSCPQTFGHLQPDPAIGSATANNPAGMILCNCPDLGSAWQATAAQAGFQSQSVKWNQFRAEATRPNPTAPHLSNDSWILLDDSCLNTSRAAEQGSTSSLAGMLEVIYDRYPGANVMVTSSLPRWDGWQACLAAAPAGCSPPELLTKPSTGCGFQRWLQNLAVASGSSPQNAGNSIAAPGL